MATDITLGQAIYTPYLTWTENGIPYKTRIKITWGIDSTDPVNNTTTLWFTGTFESTQSSNPNYGRGIRGAQVALYHKSYEIYDSGTNKIGDAYYFGPTGATTTYTYNGDIIFDWTNPSYKLSRRTITVPHGTEATKDVYICVWFQIGANTWNDNSVDNHCVLPALERDPLVNVKTSSTTWKSGVPYVKINSTTWQKATNVYVKTDSTTWKEVKEKGSI